MKLQKKQMPLLVLTLAAVGFLGYQITALIRDDIKTPAPQPHGVPANTATHTTPVAQTHAVNNTPRVHANLDALDTTANTATSEQKAYLQMANRYEIAQIQHKTTSTKP